MHHPTTITLLFSVLVSAAAGFTSGRMATTPPEGPRPQEPVPAARPQEPNTQAPKAQDPQQTPQDAAPSPVTLMRGMDLPVRSRAEAEVTEDTRTVSYEAYYDWDFGVVTLVSETGDLATVPTPRSWELRSAADSKGEMVALCFQPSTGATYVLGQKQNWERVAEDMVERSADHKPLTLGDYDIHISLTEAGTLSALRIDQMSGRTWMLAPAGWKALPGNLPASGEFKPQASKTR